MTLHHNRGVYIGPGVLWLVIWKHCYTQRGQCLCGMMMNLLGTHHSNDVLVRSNCLWDLGKRTSLSVRYKIMYPLVSKAESRQVNQLDFLKSHNKGLSL